LLAIIMTQVPQRAITFEFAELSGPFHKYGDVGGEGFFAQARREHRAYPPPSVRCEQRSLREKELPKTFPHL
jgi:hypothetical protein